MAPLPLRDSEIYIITYKHVEDCIHSLSNSKSVGVDGIPITFWVYSIKYLKHPLAKLFNNFLQHSFVPTSWKISQIYPLYKNKGAKDTASNYRPIAIICSIAKVFEKVILQFLESSLVQGLSPLQHGFRKSYSTQSNLLEAYFQVYNSLNNKHPIDIITIDLSKAFDKIDIYCLLNKLVIRKVPAILVNILASYLLDRKQLVSFSGSYSSSLDVNSGVPQGSILSPLLFSVVLDGRLAAAQIL